MRRLPLSDAFPPVAIDGVHVGNRAIVHGWHKAFP